MAYTEFYTDQANGSNLYAGSSTSTSPLTYASGNWVQSTRVFTVASGNPSSDGVNVGDFVSVYANGASAPTGFVGRVTARDATTITVSATAQFGTAPADGTGNRTLVVGGVWKGPVGASAFPIDVIPVAVKNVAGDTIRVNMKNNASYLPTSGMTRGIGGLMTFQGYTASPGDGGKFTIDGGDSGITILTSNSSGNGFQCIDGIFTNNASSGNVNGVSIATSGVVFRRIVVSDMRANGITFTGGTSLFDECEAYTCNANNTSGAAAFASSGSGGTFRNCIAHDNAGSNTAGFSCGVNGATYLGCISDTNGGHGYQITTWRATGLGFYQSCDAYNNGGDGWRFTENTAGATAHLVNCNGVKNTGYGMNAPSATNSLVNMVNCGFGQGTMANGSGKYPSDTYHVSTGEILYTANTTPWVDPANGDFRINSSEAKGAGRGAFTETAASYAGTVAYPDVGAAQHQDVSFPPVLGRRGGSANMKM